MAEANYDVLVIGTGMTGLAAAKHAVQNRPRTACIDTIAEEVLGGDVVTSVRVRNVATGSMNDIPCTGFFAYIGLQPACESVPAEVERDANGGLVTDAALQTGFPGVYAAGAVRAGYGGLLAHAVAEGKAAARAICAELGR